jgi:serine/threonine protein kinase
LAPELALAILLPIASAIEFAHSRGFFRLDIKPNNIQVSYSGQVYLMDLGIAKELNSDSGLTREGDLLGTPLYMSPEQINNGDVDARSDVYSFGAVLYEAMTGLPPFYAQDMAAVIRMQLTVEPTLPSSRMSGIPLWLDEVVIRCLSKNPANRFQSMTDLNSALRNSLDLTVASPESVALAASESQSRNLQVEVSRNNLTQMFSNPLPAQDSSISKLYEQAVQLSETPGPHLGWIDFAGIRQHYTLPIGIQFTIRIGRAPDNDLLLEEEGVSRYHSMIRSLEEGTLEVADLNSENGTFVNANRLFKPRKLAPGDRIQIGVVDINFAI